MRRSNTLHRRFRPALAAGLLTLAVTTFASPALALEKRSVPHTATAAAGEEVRFANLAGRVEIVPAPAGPVRVEATVYGEGRNAAETRRLLDGMRWVRERDEHGRDAWVLTYPVDDYEAFHYPDAGDGSHDGPDGILGFFLDRFSASTTKYRGESVRVTASRGNNVPTLYADLRIFMPKGGRVMVSNRVGNVRGGQLEGVVGIDTGSGSVDVASCRGELAIDTGSGSVHVGGVEGKLVADTGSGSIRVRQLRGEGVLDTGSGEITVAGVDARSLRLDTGSGGVKVIDGRVGNLLADTGSGGIEVRRVEVERFVGDTGSGGVVLESSLAGAREVRIDTGSGSVEIIAGPEAAFDLVADQGSGNLEVGYSDAKLRYDGREVVGAQRGNRATTIRVSTGSGSCRIVPRG